jgi:Fe-S cluster biogenesis protein NfuA
MTDAAPAGKSLEERTRDVIESFRPFIQADGGDIELLRVEDGIAHVRLRGACRSCPHAAMTLQMGVERHLRQRIPEIRGVVNDAG